MKIGYIFFIVTFVYSLLARFNHLSSNFKKIKFAVVCSYILNIFVVSVFFILNVKQYQIVEYSIMHMILFLGLFIFVIYEDINFFLYSKILFSIVALLSLLLYFSIPLSTSVFAFILFAIAFILNLKKIQIFSLSGLGILLVILESFLKYNLDISLLSNIILIWILLNSYIFCVEEENNFETVLKKVFILLITSIIVQYFQLMNMIQKQNLYFEVWILLVLISFIFIPPKSSFFCLVFLLFSFFWGTLSLGIDFRYLFISMLILMSIKVIFDKIIKREFVPLFFVLPLPFTVTYNYLFLINNYVKNHLGNIQYCSVFILVYILFNEFRKSLDSKIILRPYLILFFIWPIYGLVYEYVNK